MILPLFQKKNKGNQFQSLSHEDIHLHAKVLISTLVTQIG